MDCVVEYDLEECVDMGGVIMTKGMLKIVIDKDNIHNLYNLMVGNEVVRSIGIINGKIEVDVKILDRLENAKRCLKDLITKYIKTIKELRREKGVMYIQV